MSAKIEKKCNNCQRDNVFYQDDMKGMPLKSDTGHVTVHKPVDIDDSGSLFVECEYCKYPMQITTENIIK